MLVLWVENIWFLIFQQERRVIPGGISVEDVVVGQGKMAKNGQKVSRVLYYCKHQKMFIWSVIAATSHSTPSVFSILDS